MKERRVAGRYAGFVGVVVAVAAAAAVLASSYEPEPVAAGGADVESASEQEDSSLPVWVSLMQNQSMPLPDRDSRRLAFEAAIRNEASITWAERQLHSDDPGVFRLAVTLLAGHRRDDAAMHAALLDIARDKERPERVRTFALIAARGFGQFEEFIAHERSDPDSQRVTLEDEADYNEERFAGLQIGSASDRAAISRSLVIDSIEKMRLAAEEGEITDLRTLETEIVRIRYGVAFLRTEVSDPISSAGGLVSVLEAVSDIPADERFFDRFAAGIYVHTLYGLYAAAGEVVPIDSDTHARADREAWKGHVDRVLSVWEEAYSGGDCALEWHMLSLTRGGYIDPEIAGCGVGVAFSMMKALTSGDPFAAFSAGVVLDGLGLIDGGSGKSPRWVVFGTENAAAEEAVFDLWRSIAAGQLAVSIAAGKTVVQDAEDPRRWVVGQSCTDECGSCEGSLRQVRYWTP